VPHALGFALHRLHRGAQIQIRADL
jgi:hypothetical protein